VMSKLYYGPVVGVSTPRTCGAGRTSRRHAHGEVTITLAGWKRSRARPAAAARTRIHSSPTLTAMRDLARCSRSRSFPTPETRELTGAWRRDFGGPFRKIPDSSSRLPVHVLRPNLTTLEPARQELSRTGSRSLVRDGMARYPHLSQWPPHRMVPVRTSRRSLSCRNGPEVRVLVGGLDTPCRRRISCFFVDRPERR
jgi:hypothetical protein